MNKLYKGHYILIGLLLTTTILAILSVNGCYKSRNNDQVLANLQLKNDSLSLQLGFLEAYGIETKKNYEDSLSVANAYITIKDNQLIAKSEELNVSNSRIQRLLKNKTDVVPSDSGTTLVPNQFLYECKECWIELEGQNKLVNQFVRDFKKRDSADRIKDAKMANRINQLEIEKKQAFDIASKFDRLSGDVINSSKPRRILYISLAAISINSILPNGIGGGLKYQDKKKRIFGIKVFGSNAGAIKEGEVSLPLSFRRK